MLRRLKQAVRKRNLRAANWLRIEPTEPPRVYDYTKYLTATKPRGRVLLAYLPQPIIEEAEGVRATRFSNTGLARIFPKVLNELGYSVDIVGWDDTGFQPERDYDLFIGHGGKNFTQILESLKATPTSIYFSTGSYWAYHNEQEDARLADFKKRHGVALPRDRYIEQSEEVANKLADAIICLGNDAEKQTYKKFPTVYNLPIGSYPDTHRSPAKTQAMASHFVFYSGGGNVHKGLDIALDAFLQQPDLHLHIGTVLDNEFEAYYHEALHNTPNIHYEGFVTPRSNKYYDIMDNCAFTILPSCSEGSPGSIVDGMQLGLIPIVSRDAHIDVEPFGFVMSETTPETLRQAIGKASRLTGAELTKRSAEARHIATTRHSQQQYETSLTAIIEKIISDEKQ